jgi:hypothetical protein
VQLPGHLGSVNEAVFHPKVCANDLLAARGAPEATNMVSSMSHACSRSSVVFIDEYRHLSLVAVFPCRNQSSGRAAMTKRSSWVRLILWQDDHPHGDDWARVISMSKVGLPY